jgi:adenine deaminase
VDDPASLKIQFTWKKGVCIYDCHEGKDIDVVYDLNGRFEDTIHHEPIKMDDLKVSVPGDDRMVNVRVMKLNPNNNRSEEVFVKMPVKNNALIWKNSGCNLAVVIERHGRDGKIAFGFTCGAGLKEGACASSYAHDSHDLIAMGANEEDIVCAVNEVIAMKGGIAVSLHKEITGRICLPIAGLLSKASVEKTAEDFDNVRRAFDAQGYEHINNIMNFSLIALTCIPTLKLTDRGYMYADTFEQPPLYEEL